MQRCVLFWLPMIFSGVLLAQVADAEDSAGSDQARATARQHTRRAEIHYNLGRFQEALEEYSAAYELYPHPAFLFNLGQCHRELNQHERASFFFEGYLRELPNADNRDLAEELLEESRREAERIAEQESLLAESMSDETEADEQDDSAEPSAQNNERRRAVYRRWWFWTIIGVAVAGTAVGLGVGLTRDDSDNTGSDALGTIDWR